ncbi:MAG: invasion associated locus B family protein [Hyphomicrobiaceae bacterium]|nr:invasion associated locus B family protein [Hyphomicrobiaceae bacterium]
MAHSGWHFDRAALGAASGMAMLMAGALVLAGPAMAQDKKPAAGAAKPAAAAPADDKAAKQSAWVKLCEKAPVAEKAADGKIAKAEKEICLTHHERLDGNTGQVLVSAAVRQVEGSDKKSLMVMVPLGMAIPAGVRAAVYSTEDWAKAAKNEKVEDSKLKPVKLEFSLCHPAGCTAEVDATAELIADMKKGGGLMVLAINAGAQPIGFPVPLDGFAAAHDGKPVDNEQYAKARGQLMAQIRERQKLAYEAFRAAQAGEKKDGDPAAAKAPAAAPPKK